MTDFQFAMLISFITLCFWELFNNLGDILPQLKDSTSKARKLSLTITLGVFLLASWLFAWIYSHIGFK